MITVAVGRDPRATRAILEALPDWFGDPEAIDGYVTDASSGQFVSLTASMPEGRGAGTVGIALIERHFPESAELHLIAVAPNARGMGVGRALIEHAVSDLTADGCSMLTVHTVGPSFTHRPYAETRAFYRSLGFIPLEEHDNLDWPGPTVIMVRPLRPQVPESSA